MRRLLLPFLLLLGCGGGTPGAGDNLCTYAGAQSGKLPCRLADAVWSSASDTTRLHVLSTSVSNPVVAVELGFKGPPIAGHLVGETNGTNCSITFYDSATSTRWYASTLPAERGGSCELTLGRIVLEDATTGSYELDGTFAATLIGVEKNSSKLELRGGF